MRLPVCWLPLYFLRAACRMGIAFLLLGVFRVRLVDVESDLEPSESRNVLVSFAGRNRQAFARRACAMALGQIHRDRQLRPIHFQIHVFHDDSPFSFFLLHVVYCQWVSKAFILLAFMLTFT